MAVTTILFFKPYGVLSQFTREAGHQSLADFGPFPGDVYPVGRLDADTEGLLLLTNDNRLKHRLADPRFFHPKKYLVQVERVPDAEELRRLREGVVIDGERTRPAEAVLLAEDPDLPPRPVPIRFRRNVPTAWIALTITEGRNRQVRKMTASAGHPTLRLVRVQIGDLALGDLRPGEMRVLSAYEVNSLCGEPDKHPAGAGKARQRGG